MPDRPEDHLSRRERQIMDVLYASGEATAAEVHAGLPDAPSRTAVRTLLRILENKGHVRHKADGIRYVYQPNRPRGHAGRTAFRRVLNTFFDGSLEKAVAAHLGDVANDFLPDELARLADLISQARKKGR